MQEIFIYKFLWKSLNDQRVYMKLEFFDWDLESNGSKSIEFKPTTIVPVSLWNE
jgi:hypothetical protein